MSNGDQSNWGGANRPYTSLRLSSAPHKSEGADGDLQIRQTQLGAKLFGKIGGRWYDNPFSIDGTTKIGTKLSDHLAITREGIEVYEDDVKVASFGSTMNIGNWNMNSTSIYTGTEDHSGYTANAGDITLYSDGSDASIHAKEFYITAAGRFVSTNGTIGSGTVFADDIVTTASIANNAINDALLGFSAQSWTTDMEIRGTAYNAIIWDRGVDANPTITFADATTQEITKGTQTGLQDNDVYWVYVIQNTEGAASVYATNTYTAAVADNKILLATVVTSTAAGGDSPSIFPYKTNSLTISAVSIAANAITANAIASNTITISELATIANIALSGKIILTSAGTRNVCIGTGNNDIGTDDIVIGINAGDNLNSSSQENVLIGSEAGSDITSAVRNVCIGYDAGKNHQIGGGNIYIGNKVYASGSNVAGEGVIVAGNSFTGLGAETMILGTKLINPGTIYNTGNTAEWDTTSDVRFKTNIVNAQDNTISLINQIKVRNFNWKKEEDLPKVNGEPYNQHDPDKLRIGVIAQELEEVLPQCVGQDGHGYKSVNLSDVHYLVIKAVQELSAKVVTMQTEINNLKAE